MESLPIILRTYDAYKSIVEISAHCEKRWRYSLAASTEKSILELMEQLIQAKNAPKQMKIVFLLNASSHQEILLFKLRLFLELKAANETRIFQTQSTMREIGRMLGGWIKQNT
jgi:uncharacterized protein YehS (DUF1456 family)